MKESLIVDLSEVTSEAIALKYDVKLGTKLLTYDFTLIPNQEAAVLREARAKEAMEKLGRKVHFINGLPVPDVD